MILPAVLSRLVLSGISRLAREERSRRLILLAARIFGASAVLDSIGLPVTVPLAAFLAALGITRPRRPSKTFLAAYFAYRALYLDPLLSRDNATVYAPAAYFVVSHDPRFRPIELHNPVAVGLMAAIARPMILAGEPFHRALFPRAAASFAALYEYLRGLSKDPRRPVAMLAIPYRAYHVRYHPDYIDRLLAIATLEALSSRNSRLGFGVYGLAKQSRPPLLAAMLAFAYPRLAVVAILSIAALSRDPEKLVRIAPALFRVARPPRPRSLGFEPLRTLPMIARLARNSYVFGRPLGASMLAYAFTARSRVKEALSVLSSRPGVTLAVPPMIVLAGYLSLGSISNVQAYANAFAVEDDELLRGLSAYLALRGSIIAVFPRQSIAFRIYVIALSSRAPRIRIPTLASRLYVLALGDYYPGSLGSAIALVAIFVAAVRILSRLRLGRKRLALLFVLAAVNATIVAAYANYDYQRGLAERSGRIRSLVGEGAVMVYVSPGYIEGLLAPEIRVYQAYRIYEYPLVKPLISAGSLSDLRNAVAEAELKAFAISSVANDSSRRFLRNTPIGRLFLSDAAEYSDAFLGTFLLSEASRYHVLYVARDGYRYYGCGLREFTGESGVAAILTDASILAVQNGRVISRDGFLRTIEFSGEAIIYTDRGKIAIS